MLRDSCSEHTANLVERGCDLLTLEMMLTNDFAMDLDFQCEIVDIAKQTGCPCGQGLR